MRTINENKGELKRIYSFNNTNFECCEDKPDSMSSFYTFGTRRQVKFSGYSSDKGSRLVDELKKKFL